MGTKVSYPVEVKLKAIEMRLAGIPVKEVMETLQIRNRTQLKTKKEVDWVYIICTLYYRTADLVELFFS